MLTVTDECFAEHDFVNTQIKDIAQVAAISRQDTD